ncbi:pyocin knob domain-containing protein [Vibrio vulnificus]|uniref:pyocin knob domain-containing protein n=1 Tax=Vibrio vulnificus TaxID=672 RepID=UPI003242E8B7
MAIKVIVEKILPLGGNFSEQILDKKILNVQTNTIQDAQVNAQRDEVKKLTEEVRAAHTHIHADKATVDADKKTVAADKANVQSNKNATQTLKDQTNTLKNQTQTLKNETNTLTEEVRTAHTHIHADKATVDADKKTVAADKANVQANKNDVVTRQNDIIKRQGEITTMNTNVNNKHADVVKKHTEVEADRAEVAANKATVAADKATVAADKATTITNRQQAQTAKTAAEAARDAATAQKTEATRQAGIAKTEADRSTVEANRSRDEADRSGDSADAAKVSENAAKASQTASKTSETNAKASETAAASSKAAALASQNAAKTSETNANASKNAAKTSETNAATSASTATTKASEASTSASKAKTSETNAKASETAAKASEVKAAEYAATLAGGILDGGNVDLSTGKYPTAPSHGTFWKVIKAGTVSGVDYGVGDTLIYSKVAGFYKIDNTESVTSVNGKKGAVKLIHSDVGALSATAHAVGCVIHDTRDNAYTPSSQVDRTARHVFTNQQSPTGSWHSSLSMKGWSNGYYAWELGSSASTVSDGSLWFRHGVGETWQAWDKVYTTRHKPTAADVGAPTLLRTMNAKIDRGYDWTTAPSMSGKDYVGGFHSVKSSTGRGYISFGMEAGTLDLMLDGEMYVANGEKRVYHQGYKPTAADVGAYAKSEVPNWVQVGVKSAGKFRATGMTDSGTTTLDYSTIDNTDAGVYHKLIAEAGSAGHPSCGTGYHYVQQFRYGTSSNTTQIAIPYGLAGTNGRLAYRGKYGDTVNKWEYIYSTANKPTAADVGAVSTTGNAAGASRVVVSEHTTSGVKHPLVWRGEGGNANGFNLYSTIDKINVIPSTGALTAASLTSSTGVINSKDWNISQHTNGNLEFRYGADRILKAHLTDDNGSFYATGQLHENGSHRVYSTANKPKPADVGALATTGGTLTGNLKINVPTGSTERSGIDFEYGDDNQTGSLKYISHDPELPVAGYGFVMKKAPDNNQTHKVLLSVEGEIYADSNKRVYHAGNKPTATDVGLSSLSLNGTAKELRISTTQGNGYFGARNTSHFHMDTDRPSFYMYKPLHVNGAVVAAQIDLGFCTIKTSGDYVDFLV